MPWWYKNGDQGKYTSDADQKRCERDIDIYAAQVPGNKFIQNGHYDSPRYNEDINKLRKTLCSRPLWKNSSLAPYRDAKKTKRFKFISTKFRNYLKGVSTTDVDDSLNNLRKALDLPEPIEIERPVFKNGGNRRRKTRRRKSRRR